MTSSPDLPIPAESTCSDELTGTWLVIPLYNEAQVVRDVIEEARRTFPRIVAVDDGRTDPVRCS